MAEKTAARGLKTVEEWRASARVVIRSGDRVRFSGFGPVWEGGGARLPGTFCVRSIKRRGDRVWLEANGPCGCYLVFVAGPSYRRPDLPEVLWRPYKVKRLKRGVGFDA